MESGSDHSGNGSSSSNTNNDSNKDNNNSNDNPNNAGVLAEYKTDAIRGILAAQNAERNKKELNIQTSAHHIDNSNKSDNLSDCKQAAVRDILSAHGVRRDREDSKLQTSAHSSSLQSSSQHQTSALVGSNGAGNLSDHKSAAIQEIIAAQSVHGDQADKKLEASIHGGSFHSSSHHRTATVADAVVAAKEQARNTTAYNLGAWAVMERGRNVSIIPRDLVGLIDYNRGLHEVDNGRSIESMNYSEGEGEDEGDDESFFDNPDLDYDEEEAVNDDGLVRAFAVEEDDDEIDPAYLPAGLEFDPDAKPPELIHRQNRYRAIRFYSFVATGLVTIALMGFVVAWQSRSVVPDSLPNRAVRGIREYVVNILSSLNVVEQVLQDASNPYSRALDWIQNVDDMALVPYNGTKFTQRFLAAYLYFATSAYQPWSNGCGPATTMAFPDANNDNNCVHVFTPTSLSTGSNVAPHQIAGTRWLGPDDECTWGGVTCDLNGNVQMLDLRGSNTSGSFPVGISGLPFLQTLRLSYGGLDGPLPAFLGAMKHLRHVNLARNRFTGSIPESWYLSRSINYVDVGGNKLSGTISENVGKWKDVRILLVNENGLNGSIPSAMGQMKSLLDFSAGNNALTGAIPASLMLNHLEFLELDHNKIIGKIPTEIGRTSLQWLSVKLNRLSATIPTEMSLLSDLWGLDVSNNRLTGPIESLVNMTNLELVRINDNEFTGTLSAELRRLQKMQEFTASGNNFVGVVPRKICKLRSGEGKRDVTGQLTELQLDCSVPIGAELAEISCPDGCCTACCDTDGTNCQTMTAD